MAGAAVVCLLAATLATVHVGRAAVDRNLTWTVDGIENYTTEALVVMFGDTLNFKCHPVNISNFIYVETLEQYQACNATVNDGKTIKSGDCLGGFASADSFSQSIQRFSGTVSGTVVEYQAGKSYYFYSSSTGSLGAKAPYVGGQCLDGLKIIVHVAGVATSTPSAVQPAPSPTNPVKTGVTGGNETNGRSGLPVWAIGAIVGGVFVVLVFAIIVAVACTYCCYKCTKRKGKWCADVESGKGGGQSSPIDKRPLTSGDSVSPDGGTATINKGNDSVCYKKDPVRNDATTDPVKSPTTGVHGGGVTRGAGGGKRGGITGGAAASQSKPGKRSTQNRSTATTSSEGGGGGGGGGRNTGGVATSQPKPAKKSTQNRFTATTSSEANRASGGGGGGGGGVGGRNTGGVATSQSKPAKKGSRIQPSGSSGPHPSAASATRKKTIATQSGDSARKLNTNAPKSPTVSENEKEHSPVKKTRRPAPQAQQSSKPPANKDTSSEAPRSRKPNVTDLGW